MLKGNRTRIFGTAVLCLGVVEQYAREIVPTDYQGYLLAAVGIAIIILRELTNTPAGRG